MLSNFLVKIFLLSHELLLLDQDVLRIRREILEHSLLCNRCIVILLLLLLRLRLGRGSRGRPKGAAPAKREGHAKQLNKNDEE